MKKIASLLLILLLISCASDDNPRNDLSEENLKGKVKSVRQTSYRVVEKFGKISKGKRLTNSDDYFNVYDNQGNRIEHNSYKPYDKLEYKHTYKYDDNGNKIEENQYNGDGSLKTKYIFEFDGKGNQIKRYSYPKLYLDFWRKSTYKYDDNGNKIEENQYNENEILNYKSTYDYDDKGNMISENNNYADGVVRSKHTYKYDDKGNMIEDHSYYGHSPRWHKSTHKYEFGLKNNWVKKTQFDESRAVSIIEREIEYY